MPSIFCFDVQNLCYDSKIPSPPSTTSGIGKENNSAGVALQVIRKKWASPKKNRVTRMTCQNQLCWLDMMSPQEILAERNVRDAFVTYFVHFGMILGHYLN